MNTFMTAAGAGRIRHFLADAEETLADCLVRRLGLTPEEAVRLVLFGAVYQDRQRVTSNTPVVAGQYIRVHLQPKRFPVEEIDWRAMVVAQNDDFVVVLKPAGIPVHATVDNARENVLHQLSTTVGVPLFITQRLDTEVSGLLVLARTQRFQREFNGLLVERKVKKRYRALVAVAPATGRQVHFMEPTKRAPKTVSIVKSPSSLECALTILNVRPMACAGRVPYFDIEIDLETGRTHQIRAQLSAMGSPIVGDTAYGSPSSYEVNGNVFRGIALFSASTSWAIDEVNSRSFTLPPPWSAESV
jgi:23S rRNA pseudouridine1911/1915/1917 synthase